MIQVVHDLGADLQIVHNESQLGLLEVKYGIGMFLGFTLELSHGHSTLSVPCRKDGHARAGHGQHRIQFLLRDLPQSLCTRQSLLGGILQRVGIGGGLGSGPAGQAVAVDGVGSERRGRPQGDLSIHPGHRQYLSEVIVQCRTIQFKAIQNKAKQRKAKQSKAKQSQSKQSKTNQNKRVVHT